MLTALLLLNCLSQPAHSAVVGIEAAQIIGTAVVNELIPLVKSIGVTGAKELTAMINQIPTIIATDLQKQLANKQPTTEFVNTLMLDVCNQAVAPHIKTFIDTIVSKHSGFQSMGSTIDAMHQSNKLITGVAIGIMDSTPHTPPADKTAPTPPVDKTADADLHNQAANIISSSNVKDKATQSSIKDLMQKFAILAKTVGKDGAKELVLTMIDVGRVILAEIKTQASKQQLDSAGVISETLVKDICSKAISKHLKNFIDALIKNGGEKIIDKNHVDMLKDVSSSMNNLSNAMIDNANTQIQPAANNAGTTMIPAEETHVPEVAPQPMPEEMQQPMPNTMPQPEY